MKARQIAVFHYYAHVDGQFNYNAAYAIGEMAPAQSEFGGNFASATNRMNKKGIIHIYPAFHRRGGVERFLWEIAHWQAKTCPVTIITIDAIAADTRRINLKILKIPRLLPSALRTLMFAFFAHREVRGRSRQNHVVHTQGASSFGSDIITAHSCHKAWFKLSLAELSMTEWVFWRKLFNPVHWVTILIESIQYRRGGYRKIVAVSESVKRQLQNQFHIPADAIRVIYNGVDSVQFNDDRDPTSILKIRRSWRCDPSRVVLQFVAHEFRRKGLAKLLEALALPGMEDFHLVIAGKDNPSPFVDLASRLGIAPRLTFLGQVSDMPAFYRAGDIFIFPTLYEPFGMAVLEAMSSGLPVVTSRLAGVSEIIANGEEGRLINKPDSAEEISAHLLALKSPEIREAMGKNARTKALMISWQKVATEYFSLYQEYEFTGGG